MTFNRLFCLAALGFTSVGSEAMAHAHLTSAMPLMNSTVAAGPSELDLTFSEGLDLKFTGANVTGPENEPIGTGKASLKEGNTILVVPISGSLQAGRYTVDWHALSKDGHKTTGHYTFTVGP